MRRHMKEEMRSSDGVISIPLGLQRSGATYDSEGLTANSHVRAVLRAVSVAKYLTMTRDMLASIAPRRRHIL